MAVNADQTFSGDSIFENIYVHGKLVTPEVAESIFNSVLVKKGLKVQVGPSTFGNEVQILGWNRVTSRYDADGSTGLTGSLRVSGDVDVATAIAVTDRKFRVGLGGTVITADVSRGRVGIGTTVVEQVLDVVGSVKITDDIFDSTNSSGVNGAYLNQDAGGIRWVTVTPGNAASILVQDEGIYLQRSGVAATFTALNFVQENSAGVGTDTLVPSVDPDNPGFIGRITTRDLWGHSGTGSNAPIYRMTNVGIQNNNPSSTLDITGTLHATGSVDFDSSLNLDGPAIFNSTLQLGGNATLQSNLTVQGGGDFDTTLNVDGATTLNSTLDVNGRTDLNDVLEVDGATTLKNTLKVEDAVDFDNTLNVDGETVFNGSVELNSILKDINNEDGVGVAQTDYRLSSVGSGVSWRPSGVQTKRTLWVTKNGMDSNSGLLEGDAKFTIAAAAAIAEPGDTIKIRSGVYNEANPIGLRTDVAISGEDLRLVTIVPNNPNKDVLHVRRGCLVENLSFAGISHATDHSRCGSVAFPPTENSDKAISGYIALGPANEGPSGRWRSPYIRNCTNFMTGSIGMKINGDHANAAFTGINSLGQDLKSMVCDSFTQYNEAGIGVSITNDGYAQLVSIFTIGCEKGIYVDSGGQCDLTNSNSSFGIFGLVADGVGDTQFTGTVNTATVAEGDSFVLNNVKDDLNNVRKPFDGQAFFFKLDLDDYADTALGKTGITTAPLNLVRSIKITDGGSGYSQSAPPNVTITAPAGPEAILAELSANVSAAGTITSVDVIASGRNFLPTGVGANQQDVTISFSSGSATAVAEMDPIFFTVETATEPTNAGLTTVTFNEFVPYAVSAGSSSEFKRISRIITSSHSFEYIGAGTDINSSNPFQGGEPIPENEIVAINGGQVPFTSTDQKGNFRIGQGLTVDQTTSTIRGRDFNRAIQAQLTPLILALR
tara:strand:- start:1233 stop:4058 length:2826 start_codon:yes stop_codon:yes gene_type:complete